MERGGFVYMMTNKMNTVLYVGVTSDLQARIWEHKEKIYPRSFTSRYNINKIIYYEGFYSIKEAIHREKQLKGKTRIKKEKLINAQNPSWRDLYDEICEW